MQCMSRRWLTGEARTTMSVSRVLNISRVITELFAVDKSGLKSEEEPLCDEICLAR